MTGSTNLMHCLEIIVVVVHEGHSLASRVLTVVPVEWRGPTRGECSIHDAFVRIEGRTQTKTKEAWITNEDVLQQGEARRKPGGSRLERVFVLWVGLGSMSIGKRVRLWLVGHQNRTELARGEWARIDMYWQFKCGLVFALSMPISSSVQWRVCVSEASVST